MSTSTRETSAATAAASLFSSGLRSRFGRRRYTESEYSFLDGSARESVERVRRVLDHCYARLSVAVRASVRPRFVSAREAVHRGALLELWTNEAFNRLGYAVDFDGGGGHAAQRRPDFFVARAGAAFYVEATAVLGASVLGSEGKLALAAALKELIDEVGTPGFLLGVHLAEVGPNTAARRHVVDPLREWLAEHDPQAVLAASERGEEPQRKTLRFGGWTVSFEAIALKSLAVRDADAPGMIGTYTEGFAELDDARSLRRKLKRKATRYGLLDAPYVIALLCAGDFADDKDIADALFGSISLRFDPRTLATHTVRESDALWCGPKGSRNTSVSAVLSLPQLSSSAIAAVEPTVWLNPWATQPLAVALPWRTKEIAADGRILTHEATVSSRELLELPERWPLEG